MSNANLLNLPGLRQDVNLWRDSWGIPHIDAKSDHDAYVALGYAHAQDRMWQMEMLWRKAIGRWAEWKGQPALKADGLARKLRAAEVAQRDYVALGPEARAMLDSYSAGVNAYIEAGQPSMEYELLGVHPDKWLPWYSIAVMRQIGFLMGSVWMKLFRALALPVVGAENIGKLRYDDGGNDRLCTGAAMRRAGRSRSSSCSPR